MSNYDVIVIGGGPAGMIAAGRAAECGAKVLLLEKNSQLGKKLRITGGGRCNITNAETDVRKMVAKYGPKGKALFGAFTRFGVEQSLDFFQNQLGLPVKVEAEKRAFPKSDNADDVWKALLKYMKQGKVEVLANVRVKGFIFKDNQITGVKTEKGEYSAKNYILATGGKSRPETGSTGDGFGWLKDIGHTVAEPDAALVPIKISEDWVKKSSGLSFKEVGLTAFQGGQKQVSATGKLLLTHFGISGPLALNMSRNIAELHKYEPVQLQLDLYPNLDFQAIDKLLLENLNQALNKRIKNNLGLVIPPRLILPVLEMEGIDPELAGNELTKPDRLKIAKRIKALPMTVTGFLGPEKAIVTAGGISLKEVDFKTMQSKKYANLFLAGDILDFDRRSGGYSLQICWTTGYLAGQNAAGII